MRPALAALSLILVSFFAISGCQSGTPAPRKLRPKAYELVFTTDASLSGTSIQVDVVGANGIADLPQLENYSMTDYWKPQDPLRRSARKMVLMFGAGRPTVQKISVTDPQWSDWLSHGTQFIVVMADLPGGGYVDRPGNADSRRQIVPLDVREWSQEDETIRILISESGLKVQTPRASR